MLISTYTPLHAQTELTLTLTILILTHTTTSPCLSLSTVLFMILSLTPTLRMFLALFLLWILRTQCLCTRSHVHRYRNSMYTTTSSNRQSSLYVLDCYFLSAMPPKYLATFSYIYPTKKPLYDKVWTLVAGVFWAEYSDISKRVVQLLGSAKNCPAHEPCYTPQRKIFYECSKKTYGCQRSALKILGLLCRLGLVLQLGSVWLVSGNNLVALCIAIW